MKNGLKFLCAVVCFAVVGMTVADEDHTISPRQVLNLSETEVLTSGVHTVRGVVTFVSGIASNRFVIAPQEHPSGKGIGVELSSGEEIPSVGDLVLVGGRLGWHDGVPELLATELDIVRNETLSPHHAKQSDFRRGILEGRRVELQGTVREVRHSRMDAMPYTELNLCIENYTAIVRVPGELDPDRYRGEPIRLVGLARSFLNESGHFLDAWLEVGSELDIEMLRPKDELRALVCVSAVFGLALLILAGVFLFLWIHGRRERHEMEVIAVERRRMAADLHDTIEQHLAGANLLAAGVMALPDTPEDVKEAMTVLTGLLANAKAEVRSAVLNLRSAGDSERTLEEKIGEMAQALNKTGIRTRKCLRGLPVALPEGVFQDIVLVLREATTNAVKHGHAKSIVFTADPHGEKGFVLRVLNDGEPFAIDRALGPETGHYGLSGMKERALRNRLAISWSTVKEWTCMELVSEGL